MIEAVMCLMFFAVGFSVGIFIERVRQLKHLESSGANLRQRNEVRVGNVILTGLSERRKA